MVETLSPANTPISVLVGGLFLFVCFSVFYRLGSLEEGEDASIRFGLACSGICGTIYIFFK